jgi:hypothetical protein
VVLATSVAGSAGVASNARSFTDPRGDACCTEDITRVVVTNDDAGKITFAITAPLDIPVGGASDSFIPITTERREYLIQSNPDTPGYSLVVWPYTSKSARVATIRASKRGDVFRFFVDRHLLGDAERFSFDIQFWSVTPLGGANLEAAPDRGSWTFPIKINLSRIRPALTLRETRLGRSRTLVARLALRVGQSRRLLASGTIVCTASARGRNLILLERRFVHRRALCRWQLPRRSTRTTVSGRVAVRVTRARDSVKAQTFRLVAK